MMNIKAALKFAAVMLGFATLMLPAFNLRANSPYLNGSSYIKGANLPWFEDAAASEGYYNDIATNPHPSTGSGCIYNSAQMNGYLADLHKMGVTVVRFWLNTDDQGCTLDAHGNVTGVIPQFWTNLDNIVYLAGSNGISLYLNLSEGRADWLTNPGMANAYKTNCLIPLVRRYQGNTNVFGLDLMNEIDNWVADPVMGNPWISSGATWAQAQAYMTNFSAAVHQTDPNRLVSCSQFYHGWSNLHLWKGLGLDFYDFHEYADTIALPPVASLNVDKPVLVGECGQANADLTWSDSLQTACELEALNSGYSGGYAGVCIWSYALPDWQTQDFIQYGMLNANGSWRQVCYAMQNWHTATVSAISAFTPASGPPGISVVITGTNFTGATAVAFNGVAASFTVNSATQITATVPAGAAPGPISVTTADGPAMSTTNFTPVTDLVIYSDTLGLVNEFADGGSWASVNYENTSPVYAGSYSISVAAARWQALWIYYDDFNTAPYASLSFWINGGAAGASGVDVTGVVADNYQTLYSLPALAPNTWTQFNIPLSALGVANITDCQGFWFYATGSATVTFYVDSIQLNIAAPPALAAVSTKPQSGSFVLHLSGLSGQSYRMQTSTNLATWTPVSTNTLTYASVNVTNPATAGASRQFWRAYVP